VTAVVLGLVLLLSVSTSHARRTPRVLTAVTVSPEVRACYYDCMKSPTSEAGGLNAVICQHACRICETTAVMFPGNRGLGSSCQEDCGAATCTDENNSPAEEGAACRVRWCEYACREC
jgi:hypothetical protein